MSENNPDNPQDASLDISIMYQGWINLYWKPEILSHDTEVLKAKGYKIEEFDFSEWDNPEEGLHTQFQKRFDFPDYYGRNLNALNDCLSSDLVIDKDGLVIVFRHADIMSADRLNGFLDVIVHNAMRLFIFGKKLLLLVQVDNRQFTTRPICAINVAWNAKEWSIFSRQ